MGEEDVVEICQEILRTQSHTYILEKKENGKEKIPGKLVVVACFSLINLYILRLSLSLRSY